MAFAFTKRSPEAWQLHDRRLRGTRRVCLGALRLANPIGRLQGRTGINIATRLMGLILAAISVEFIFDGAKALWGTN